MQCFRGCYIAQGAGYITTEALQFVFGSEVFKAGAQAGGRRAKVTTEGYSFTKTAAKYFKKTVIKQNWSIVLFALCV